MNEEKQKAQRSRLAKMSIFYFALLAVAGVAIICFMVRTMFVQGEEWREKARQRENATVTEVARRGNIYSSDGKILVSTTTVWELRLDLNEYVQKTRNGEIVRDVHGNPKIYRNIEQDTLLKYLDQACDILYDARPRLTRQEYRDLILQGWEDKNGNLLVARNLPQSVWTKLAKLPGWRRMMIQRDTKGQSLKQEKREYTFPMMAIGVIGLPNDRERGTWIGLEGYYNNDLRGQDGIYHCHRLARGLLIPADEADTSMTKQPLIPGSHIVSTIDSRYQDVSEVALRRMLTRFGGSSGCAILMEIETGRVLACASLTRDSSGSYSEHPYDNVAVNHRIEPGSTFKSVVLTAMMNDTIIDTAMRVRTGYKNYGKDAEVKDSRGHDTPDTHSVAWTLIHSSNVGMAELGVKYYAKNPRRLRNEIQRIFPYGEKGCLGVDLTTLEPRSYINDPANSISDFVHMCYGYSTAVTPLQIVTFYAALGHPQQRLMKPHFCQAIIRAHGDTVRIRPEYFSDEPICSPEVARMMRTLLTDVVERGTGKVVRNRTYSIAGKTGTANTRYGGGRGEMNNGSFAGYFPADNPKYACYVLGENIGENNGAQTAVAFKEIADCVMAMDRSLGNVSLSEKLRQLEENKTGVEPWVRKARQERLMRAYALLGMPYLTADSASRWTRFDAGVDSLHIPAQYAPYDLPSGLVPDCAGMTAREAVALLKSLGLRVKVLGVGRVKSQEPKARTPYKENTSVTLQLAN